MKTYADVLRAIKHLDDEAIAQMIFKDKVDYERKCLVNTRQAEKIVVLENQLESAKRLLKEGELVHD